MTTRKRLRDLERRLAGRREREFPSTELFVAHPGAPGRDADGFTAEEAARRRAAEERGARIVIIRVLCRRDDDGADAGAGVKRK